MRTYEFHHVDVFTDRAFGGNPLAVFPDAEGLSDQEMQQLAKEFNLSETVFVLPPTDEKADFKLRIFTPAMEVPLAGHPVVGTHYLLAKLERIELEESSTRIHQELNVGVFPVDLYVENGQVHRVVMTQALPEFLGTWEDTSRLGAALGVPDEEIRATGLLPQLVSTGMPQLMIPVHSLAAVQKAKPNPVALLEIGQEAGTQCFAIFSKETLFGDSDIHTRMFAPGLGVPEDPATGSASGGLGAYLVENHVFTPGEDGVTYLVNEQGYELDRPSTIYIEVYGRSGDITAVRVGGQVVQLIECTVSL
jgi:trans-2,3-dihydro-3-hydroxyanthranilate isomerase